jgi:hypothetical protein
MNVILDLGYYQMIHGSVLYVEKVYLPEIEPVRKATDFYIPEDKKNITPAVTSIGSEYYRIQSKREPNYQGSFKQLAAKGLKITNYTVKGGDGKPIQEKEEEDY